MTNDQVIAFHTTIVPFGTPPEWVHLLPSGTFKGNDGCGPYHVPDPAKLIAASMQGGPLPIDENHSTDLAAPTGKPSPARGWIVEMQPRADGVWGRVQWNESGRALLSDRAYRGISPVLAFDKPGIVAKVLRASLTNTPNLAQLASLHSKSTGGLSSGANDPRGDELTQIERDVCEKMNLDPVAFARHKLGAPDPFDGLNLTEIDRDVCRKMNLDPRQYATNKSIHGLR